MWKPGEKQQRILIVLALSYVFWCVFLGGFPFRSALPGFLYSGKAAVAVLALCILATRGSLQGLNRSHFGEVLILFFILCVGGLLRFRGIAESSGWLPTIDEPLIVRPVLRMMRTGTLDPLTYEYGGATFYLLLSFYVIVVLRLAATFTYRESAGIPDQVFYVAGRYATAALSLLTVAAVYGMARRFFGKLPAIIASLVLALSSLSYSMAHQIRLDIPLALFVLAAHYFFLRILEEPLPLHYWLAGLFCGLSIATKYTVGSLFVSLLLAHVLALNGKRLLNWNLVLALGTAAVVFVLFNFFSFAHLNQFLDRLPRAIYHNLTPEHWSATGNRALTNFTDLATIGLGAVALIPALFALFSAVLTKDNRILVLWCFPLLLLVMLGSYSSGFPRYLVPALPVLAVLSGVGTQILMEKAAKRFARAGTRAAAILAVIAIAAFPAWGAARYWIDSGRVLQPSEITDWVQQNVPEGSPLILDPTGPVFPEGRYELKVLTFRDFQSPRNFKNAPYILVSENLFSRIPDHYLVLKEFPARTKGLDRTFRLYGP